MPDRGANVALTCCTDDMTDDSLQLVPLGDLVALLLEPFEDGSLRHRLAHRGHLDQDGLGSGHRARTLSMLKSRTLPECMHLRYPARARLSRLGRDGSPAVSV